MSYRMALDFICIGDHFDDVRRRPARADAEVGRSRMADGSPWLDTSASLVACTWLSPIQLLVVFVPVATGMVMHVGTSRSMNCGMGTALRLVFDGADDDARRR